MKLAIVFPVMNQSNLAECAINWAIKNLSDQKVDEVEVLILDNNSDVAFVPFGDGDGDMFVAVPPATDFGGVTPGSVLPTRTVKVRTVRLEKNIGVYPTFWEALKHTDADVLAFFHTDLIISEKGWDSKVLAAFNNIPNLGLVGFIGSNEIDANGGRGLGTTSNFQGMLINFSDGMGNNFAWQGSPAAAHGRRDVGFTNAAVVDGCAMILRREVLEKIKQRENFPPHHFYDRLLSSEVSEAGYRIGVLGIECDHISGQTVNQEPAYQELAKAWAEEHKISLVLHQDQVTPNWDATLYREAERQWLEEYRDIKHLVPCKV